MTRETPTEKLCGKIMEAVEAYYTKSGTPFPASALEAIDALAACACLAVSTAASESGGTDSDLHKFLIQQIVSYRMQTRSIARDVIAERVTRVMRAR